MRPRGLLHTKTQRKGPPNREEAEQIAIAALTWIASDPDRLGRFLDLTGLDPGALRKAAAEPAFLRAVLDHLAGHEPDYLAFAADRELAPERVEAARLLLGD